MANGLGIATDTQELIRKQQPRSEPDLDQLLQLQQPREEVPAQAAPAAPAEQPAEDNSARLAQLEQLQKLADQGEGRQAQAPPQTRAEQALAPDDTPFPSFTEEPLNALGLMLRNVAAGFQGKELPSDQLLAEHRKNELLAISLRIDRSNHFMKIMDKGLEIAGSIKDPDQRNKVIDSFSSNFTMFPDLAAHLKEISSGSQQADIKFALLRKSLPALNILAGGDDQLFDEIINNGKLFNAMVDANSRTKRGFLTKKIPEIIDFARERNIRMETVDDIFAINDQLPEPLGPLELDALSKQSGIAARFGLRTQKQVLKDAGKDRKVLLTKEQIKAAGLPEGSVVQQGSDGSISVIFKPSKADDLIKIEDQDVSEEVEDPSGETLFDLAEDSTGLVSGALEAFSDTIGQIPGVPIAKETIKARQRFKTAITDLVEALSINKRFPVSEIKRLKEAGDISPSLFKSPGALKERLEALRSFLTGKITQAKQDMANPNISDDDRESAISEIRSINNFLDNLGKPEDEPLTPEQLKELDRMKKKFMESFNE